MLSHPRNRIDKITVRKINMDLLFLDKYNAHLIRHKKGSQFKPNIKYIKLRGLGHLNDIKC